MNSFEGFGSALAKVAANRELSSGLRQISFIHIARTRIFSIFFIYFVPCSLKEEILNPRVLVLIEVI